MDHHYGQANTGLTNVLRNALPDGSGGAEMPSPFFDGGNLELTDIARDLLTEKLTKQGKELDPDVFAEMQADVTSRIEACINRTILNALPTSKLSEFDNVMAAD